MNYSNSTYFIFSTILFTLIFNITLPVSAADWYNAEWKYRQEIVTDKSSTDGTVTIGDFVLE